jgi:hypothetical protein
MKLLTSYDNLMKTRDIATALRTMPYAYGRLTSTPETEIKVKQEKLKDFM